MTLEQREKFEADYKSKYQNGEMHLGRFPETHYSETYGIPNTDRSGQYVMARVEHRWLGWQASALANGMSAEQKAVIDAAKAWISAYKSVPQCEDDDEEYWELRLKLATAVSALFASEKGEK